MPGYVRNLRPARLQPADHRSANEVKDNFQTPIAIQCPLEINLRVKNKLVNDLVVIN